MISIKSKREIELMKEACKVTALTYDYIEKIIKFPYLLSAITI